MRRQLMFIFSVIVILILAGQNLCSRLVDPKLDFRSEDNNQQMDKYPELGINHKLYNVRVIVDAARGKLPRNMDAEVFSEDIETGGGSGKTKKTVGIQTNITIEVSDEDKSGSRDSNSADEDTENASVPVFKGKRVDPMKNRPETKLIFDYSGSSEASFPRQDEDSFRNQNWFYFQAPSPGYWTTAKPRVQDNYIPYGIGLRTRPIPIPIPSPTPDTYPEYLRVKPCQCKFHNEPSEFDRPIPPYRRSEEVYFSRGSNDFNGPSYSSSSAGVDDKLEYPFHA